MLYLHRVAPYLPRRRVPLADLAGRLGLRPSEVQLYTRFLGLDRIADAGDLSLLEMLVSAGEDALAGTDRTVVRHLVHTHTMQHVMPVQSRLVDTLRHKLGLEQAAAFSMSHLNCVASLYAMAVAEPLLRTEPAGSRVLVVSGEKISSPVIQVIEGSTVLGEAAVACLIGLEPIGDAVLAVAHRTLGEFHECRDADEGLRRRYQQVYVPTLTEVITEAVARAGHELHDIALILPHNVNRISWRKAADVLGYPLDRIYLDNLPELGHCFCADPFVNLATARAAGRLREGDAVVLVSAGLGATFTAAVLRIAEGRLS